METKAFVFDGAEFVTNNYAAILENDGIDADFHLIQDFLRSSEVGFALTNQATSNFWKESSGILKKCYF